MPALANFFITEDGYLMLTVARNMALGEGMSVSNGTIPTNGIQPMIGVFFAVPYLRGALIVATAAYLIYLALKIAFAGSRIAFIHSETPLGALMVSTEGACAAYYNFGNLPELLARREKKDTHGAAA